MGLFKPNLERMEKKKKVHGLIEALGNKDRGVCEAAAKALVRIGTPAVEPLYVALKGDHRFGWRASWAAWALAEIGNARAVELLCAAIRDSKSWVRKHAAGVLVKIGAPAVEPLCIALRDENRDVRKDAAEVLDKIGLPDDPTTQVWHAMITGKWARAVSLGSVAVEPLCAALKDNDGDVRSKAALALGEIRDVRAVKPLIVALEDRSVRENAIAALGKIGDMQAVRPLSTCWVMGNWSEEIAVNRALDQIMDAYAVESLIEALKDSNSMVRKAALRAFKKKTDLPGDPIIQAWHAVVNAEWSRAVSLGAASVEPLIKAIRDGSSDVLKAAAEALGEIGDVQAVEPLINLIVSSDCGVAAAKALVRIGPSAMESLYMYTIKGEWQRKESKKVLKAVGLPSALATQAWHAMIIGDWARATSLGGIAVEPLCAALKKDSDEWVRKAAAEALGEIGDVRAVEPLCAAFEEDGKWWLKEAAAKALGKIGDARAVKPLIGALVNRSMLDAAAEALGKIGDAQAVKPLIDILKGDFSNGRERRVAAEALVALYHRGRLDAQAKQKILAMRATMAKAHHDYSDYSPCLSHHDTGIGVIL